MESETTWTSIQKITFRWCFIFFCLSIFPADVQYYQYIVSINWRNISFTDLLYLSAYHPATGKMLMLISGLSIAGTAIWSLTDKGRNNYRLLYYLLRIILRYRLALAFIAYGFIYLFPLHSPFPSISHLNTNYGDFTRWKIFSMSLGIAPSYSFFLGIVQIITALLLLFRKYALPGTIISIIFLGNVFLSNWAYEGADVIYSFYLLCIAVFLFAFDAVKFHTLFSLQQPTHPNYILSIHKEKWWLRLKVILKIAFITIFFLPYGYKSYTCYRKANFQYPDTPGLQGITGLYDVSEFSINNHILPYSLTDTVRWENIVFEKWATVSIKSNKSRIPAKGTYVIPHVMESKASYELSGTGGRLYYSLQADTTAHTLILQNKNNIYPHDRFVFHYQLADSNNIILTGTDPHNDSLFIVLRKIDKRYLLQEAGTGKNNPVKL